MNCDEKGERLWDFLFQEQIDEFAKFIRDGSVNVGLLPLWAGSSILHVLVEKGYKKLVCLVLNAKGGRDLLNTYDDISLTPLMCAVQNGNIEIAAILLNAGADVNAHDESMAGSTAVREAAEKGDVEMVRLLLAAGADPRISGWMGVDAVTIAERRQESNPSEANKTIVSMLRAAQCRAAGSRLHVSQLD